MKTCFAIWYKHKSSAPEEKLEVQLHLNLWKLNLKKKEGDNNHKYFLDIGIMIPDPSNVANINIYSPIKIEHNEIQDLGEYFQGNRLVAAIFNEAWSVKPLAHSKILQVEDSNNSIQFYIYMIDVKNDIKISQNYYGSIINLQVKSDANINS